MTYKVATYVESVVSMLSAMQDIWTVRLFYPFSSEADSNLHRICQKRPIARSMESSADTFSRALGESLGLWDCSAWLLFLYGKTHFREKINNHAIIVLLYAI